MIPLLPLFALGGLLFVDQPIEFVEQPIDHLIITRSQRDTELVDISARCADIDGDGENDIVTPRAVAFQRDGLFPKAQQTPLPAFGETPIADVWGNEIFVLLRERIEVMRWSNSEWQKTLSQPMTWGPVVNESHPASGIRAKSTNYWFEHFLCDLNADKKPEIVRAAADGIHVYARKDLYYEEVAVWRILPRMEVNIPARPLWPPQARSVELPSQSIAGNLQIGNGNVRIMQEEPLGNGRVRFTQAIFPFDAAQNYTIAATAARTLEGEPVDTGFRPCELNKDETIDLIDVRIAGETAPPLPMPIIDTTVSTDGGKTYRTVRSLGAVPRRTLVDYNQDGRVDLVAESKRLMEGGIRETLVRGLTRKEVDQEIQVWLQDDKGHFPEKPTFTSKFTIELDRHPANQSRMFLDFLQGSLVSLAGDFDGDGIRDAAVQDHPNRIAIRRGTPKGIDSAVYATATVPEKTWFRVADIDGDGHADLLVGLRAYLSRGKKP